MKIAHLHLQDGMGGKSTLICRLEEGSIRYTFYGGWGSSGIGYALSNLQCTLPVEKINDDETVDQFKRRLIHTINHKSVERVIKEVDTNVTFKS